MYINFDGLYIDQFVIDHYARSSFYTRSFSTAIKLYVGHFLWSPEQSARILSSNFSAENSLIIIDVIALFFERESHSPVRIIVVYILCGDQGRDFIKDKKKVKKSNHALFREEKNRQKTRTRSRKRPRKKDSSCFNYSSVFVFLSNFFSWARAYFLFFFLFYKFPPQDCEPISFFSDGVHTASFNSIVVSKIPARNNVFFFSDNTFFM